MKQLYKIKDKRLVCVSEKETEEFNKTNSNRIKLLQEIQIKEKEIENLKSQLKKIADKCKHPYFYCDEGYYFDITYCASCGIHINDI